MTVEVAVRADAVLGEGPRWDAPRGRLLWVDIERGELHRFEPASGRDEAVALGDRVGVAVPTAGGELLVALADRLALVDENGRPQRTLAELPHGEGLRANDGNCDPAGRFWIGTMALDERPGAGALYRFSPEAGLERVLDGVTLSNGIGWSGDGRRMLYVDSPTQRVDVFDFDVASGTVSGRRPFVEIDPDDGIPDGLALDDEDGVWVALYGGGAVRRYDAGGTLERVVELPAANVTACCLGGRDGRSLYVTTAAQGLSAEEAAEQPLAGSVFVTRVEVPGPPVRPFAHGA